ncbi:uncharacterized protein VICG_01591 [Vittaforma corneae ATCC 50505]|uniref:Anaphase-promoting complex subunit 4 WD40 domain-containing protein n=1 Tax=Vittaforma corneae (strain ATCC 50505) TaxID=993615 RepID=L2GKH1_VITCO|nr:uncharacterized protein VICG_01591 [Vittaforma corneae ATCC 50505]ELA41351.1 hypothetical protein VICG_01591 [Vittaforma corneae ATCC 50505]
MAKRSVQKTREEPIEEIDLSSEDYETYRPTGTEEGELEVDEEAYSLLEYISLEWPSMSLDICKSRIVLGTFPDRDRTEEHDNQIVEVELERTADGSGLSVLEFRTHPADRAFNKVRICNAIFALSDSFLTKFDLECNVVAEVKGFFRFGLHVSDSYVIVGCENGNVEVYSHSLELLGCISSGESPIECVGFDDARSIIATGSLDHRVRIFDLKGELLSTIENDSEVNSLDARNGHVVFGDDNGRVHLVNLETGSREVFEWHCTPISFVRWRDDEVFVTGSDEQVCLWDITLEDEQGLDVPRSLLFVHQGQRCYKDCAFYGSSIAVTSEDGLCVFEPVSFAELSE